MNNIRLELHKQNNDSKMMLTRCSSRRAQCCVCSRVQASAQPLRGANGANIVPRVARVDDRESGEAGGPRTPEAASVIDETICLFSVYKIAA